MPNKNNNKTEEAERAKSIFDLQIDAAVTECGRVGLSFDRTFAVLMLRIGDDTPVSEGVLTRRKAEAHILWQKGVDIRTAEVAQHLDRRFAGNLTGSYADMEAHHRTQAVDDEISRQFGGDD